MKSKIYHGEVLHRRAGNVAHQFSYPAYFYRMDLDELPDLDQTVFGFGHNRVRVASIHDQDYLDGKEGSIATRLDTLLDQWPEMQKPSRVELVTTARYLHYTFNPVSFFLLYTDQDELYGLISEINNTFGDRHLYGCGLRHVPESGEWVGHAEKAFHVSPFFDLNGEYEFRIRQEGDRFSIDVDLQKDGAPALQATISGTGSVISTASFWKTVIRFPFSAVLTIPRIYWQAARLRFQKKCAVYRRPEPKDPMTVQHRPLSVFDRFYRTQIHRLFSRIEHGCLTLTDPDGQVYPFGGKHPGPKVNISIQHRAFYKRLVLDSDIGLAEAYMYGDVDVENCTALLELFIANRECLGNGDQRTSWFFQWVQSVLHVLRRNTVKNSRKNIHTHYDLSNEFFALFLDPTLSYSCAMFQRSDDSLETAQRNKMHSLIQQAQINPECHVLEIGTGWGGLAMEMVRQTGCRVTTITVSEEQFALAKERVASAGMTDRIDVQFCDYRQVEGTYDRIVSVEMLEAVGHAFLPVFFEQCGRLLSKEGLMVLQVITIPEIRYERYRKRCDFIQKHIFPGGHLPSVKAMVDAASSRTALHIDAIRNIGPDYAPTLKAWREEFEAQKDRLREMGFDEVFYRKWMYYFSYCEAAFQSGTLNVHHLTWTHSCNPLILKRELEGVQSASTDVRKDVELPCQG